MSLVIRKAAPEEAALMRETALANKVEVSRLHEFADRGFTIWPRSAESYKAAIEKSNFVLIAEFNGRVAGHVLAYDLGVMKQLAEAMDCEDKVLEFLSQHFPVETLYVDQITIRPEFQRQGVGRALCEELVSQISPATPWVTAVVHEPVRNIASVKFFESFGFEEYNEVPQDEWTIGIYRK